MRIFQYWGKTPIHIFKNLNEFQSRKSIYLETSQWNEENQRQREKSYIALGPRQKIFFFPPQKTVVMLAADFFITMVGQKTME